MSIHACLLFDLPCCPCSVLSTLYQLHILCSKTGRLLAHIPLEECHIDVIGLELDPVVLLHEWHLLFALQLRNAELFIC